MIFINLKKNFRKNSGEMPPLFYSKNNFKKKLFLNCDKYLEKFNNFSILYELALYVRLHFVFFCYEDLFQ